METEKRRGNSLGIWCFKVLLRIFGLRASYLLLYPVCLYYLIFDRDAVEKAEAYVERRFPGSGKIIKNWHIYKLFVSQGKQLIDRHAYISGKKHFNIKLDSDRLSEAIRESANGAILLTSHVGNWQVTMEALRNIDKSVYLVMDEEANRPVREAMDFLGSDDRIGVLREENSTDLTIEILKKLKEGNLVAIMGDRRYGQKVRGVDFLGEEAYFPYGTFSLASAVDCPIIVLFSSKQSVEEYVVEVPSVIYTENVEREKAKKDQFASALEEYIGELEKYVQRFPHQCFLFENIWENRN